MREVLKDLLLAVSTGLLLLLSFPYPDLGFLAFFALTPLLIVFYKASPLKSFAFGCLAGVVFFAGISYWLAIYGALPYILIIVAMGLSVGLFGLGSSFVARRAGSALRILFIPSFWVALEFLRSEFGSWSYPYGVIGYSQHNFLSVIQIASILGVYGVSFLVVLVNTSLAELFNGRDFSALARAIVVAVLVLSLGYGFVRIKTFQDPGEKLRLAVVQVSIPESLERLPDNNDVMRKYERAIFKVVKASSGHLDLVVLPESTLPTYVTVNDPLFYQVQQWARCSDTPLLVGVPALGDNKAFNTAKLFSNRGKVLGSYAKIYPVPFGEFVPIRAVTERLYEKTAMLGDITPGNNLTIFRLPDHRAQSPELRAQGSELRSFSVLLCSESSYANLARRMVGKGANLIFVLSNDAWFLKTAEADQHFAMSKLRAVENGRYLVQSANSGISGFVTPTGKVLKKSRLFEVVTLKDEIAFRDGKTFYNRFGFLFPYLALAITILVILCSLVWNTLGRYKY